MSHRQFVISSAPYTPRGLGPLQRRQEILEHLEALVSEGVIDEELASRLYDTAIEVMNCEYGWPNSYDNLR